jgi:hypothetical protein
MGAINKILPRYLNKDDDERLVKETQMTDAQNVRVSVDVDKDSLVLKNAWGNTDRAVTIQNGEMPGGTNVVVGAVGDDATGQVYYFVYNSGNNHSIFRYDQNAKKTYFVYKDSVLQFAADSFVVADIVKLSNGNILLYFNDGVTAPKKINATLAELSFSNNGVYPNTFKNGTAAQRLEYITVAKTPPLIQPVLTFANNASFPLNNIYTKNFQFAYQYEYIDGEQSALSPYSRLSLAPNQLRDGFNDAGQENFFNQINITVYNSTADVDKIKVYGRLGDKDAAFFLIDEVNNVNGSTSQVVQFRNDSNYIGLSAFVQDKIYDNVPQQADSQSVNQGRLFYGGYTEGYNNLTSFDASVVANYNEKPETYNISVIKTTGTDPDTGKAFDNRFTVNYADLPATFTENSTIFLSFTWNDGAVIIRNNLSSDKDYDFLGPQGSNGIKVSNDGSGNLVINFTTEQAALTGIRVNEFGQAGINVDGALNAPPRIKFVVQKGTSDTREEEISINEIVKGIKLISSGVQIREKISIAAGSTRSQAMNAIRDAIQKLRPVQFEPQAGSVGFSVVKTGGDTPSNQETASFRGKGNAYTQLVATTSTTHTYQVKIDRVNFKLNKLTFGTKEAELIEPDGIVSTFDIIEGSSNSQNLNNRLRGLTSFQPTLEGQFVKMNDQDDKRDAKVTRNGSYVTSGGCFAVANDGMFGSRCFKSGSNHEFGIVYFDDRGRSGSVQPFPNETFIKHTNNRGSENNLDGFADVTVRIRHTPPTWAKRYSIVYPGQGSIINKVQYGIGGAYTAFNDESVQGAFGATKNIYLSLNTLQSKSNSYDNQLGAQINYGYAPGDLLRIVRFGDNQKSTAIWRVSGVVTLLADSATNPLLDRSSKASVQNTTGDFLVIEDNGTAFFNYNSIAKGISYWNDDCIVEIYRPNKAFDNIFYYEIGENHAIVSGAHVGERATTTSNVFFNSTQSAGTVVAYSVARFFKGDIIRTAGGAQIVVGNVMESSEISGYNYKFYGTTSTSWNSGLYASMTVQNPDCVLQIDQGDSYFRMRTLFVGSAPQPGDVWKNIAAAFSQNAIVDFIEDPRVSDFFESGFTSLGRRFFYSPDTRTIKRYGSITYSDQFNFENTTLGLSSFNLQQGNYVDLSYDYGSIRSLVSYDEAMYVIHERRSGVVPVKRNIITSDSGESLVATNQVLGPVKYYVGEYGCNDNPESVAAYRGQVFFVDAKAGKVCRLSTETGIDIISEQLVDSFFKSKMFATSTTAANRKYIGGVDRENNEYIISSPSLFTSTITIVDNLTGNTVTGAGAANSAGNALLLPANYNNSLTFSLNSDPRNYEDVQDNWETSGQSLVIVDQLTNSPWVAFSEDLSPSQAETVQNAIYVPVTTSSFSAFGTASYSQTTSALSITNSEFSTVTIGTPGETLGSFTIAYDVLSTWWSTRYSYIAEEIMSLSDRLYTFKNGKIYEHNPDAARNTFYGVASDSVVEVVSNYNPSMIKAFQAISIEGNSGNWVATLTTTDQTSSIATSIWQQKEGFYYAPIHRDSTNNVSYTATANITSVNGTSEIFSLGVVDSVATSNITFKNPINNMAFPLGLSTAIYKLNSASNRLEPLNLYATAVGGEKILTCNTTVSGLSQNDEVVLIGNSAIEGDALRSYYLKANFTNSSTSPHELYAFNFIYSKSNLHNQQGQ